MKEVLAILNGEPGPQKQLVESMFGEMYGHMQAATMISVFLSSQTVDPEVRPSLRFLQRYSEQEAESCVEELLRVPGMQAVPVEVVGHPNEPALVPDA